MFPAHQVPGNEHECDLDAPCPTCGNQQNSQPLISNCGGCSSPQSKEPFGSGHCPRIKPRPPPPKKETPCRRPETGAKKVGPTPETCTEPCTIDCGSSKKNESCQERRNKGEEPSCGIKKCPNKFEKPDYCGMLKAKPKPPCGRTKFDDALSKRPFRFPCGPKGYSCCHQKGDAFKKNVEVLPKEKPIPNPCGIQRKIDPNNPCEMYGGDPCKRVMEGKKCSTSCQDRLKQAACAGCDRFNTNKIEEFPTVCPCQQKPKPKRPPCTSKKLKGGEGDNGFCTSKKIDRCAMLEDPIRKKRCEAYANMKFDKVDPNLLGAKKPGRVCPKKEEAGCVKKRSDEEANRKTTCPCCDDKHDELFKKPKPSPKKGPPPTEYESPCKRRAAENKNSRAGAPLCNSKGAEGGDKFCCGGEGCEGGAKDGGPNADTGPCAGMKSQPSD